MDREIFRISQNILRAVALREMAKERLADIKREKKTYKIIEQYYEIIKELITALMYSDGFKTLSHKSLLVYLEKKYNKNFVRNDFIMIDELRRLRNSILYYGTQIEDVFLLNQKPKIKTIISKLLNISNKKF